MLLRVLRWPPERVQPSRSFPIVQGGPKIVLEMDQFLACDGNGPTIYHGEMYTSYIP